MNIRKANFLIAAILLVLFSASSVFAQKKDLTEEDVKKWERLAGTVLSNDGNWLAYSITLVDGDGRLVLMNVDTKREFEFPVSSRPVFSDDNSWFAFTISLPKKELDKMSKDNEPVRS